MKFIIPMAGMGKRMRPHTLTVPKPLLPIAGKPIVQRLVEDLYAMWNKPVESVHFVINPNFGSEVEEQLKKVAESIGAKGEIVYQHQAKGTAHAIYMAEKALDGNVIVAFADTLFRAEFTIAEDLDGVIWVKKVEDPSAFGVVTTNEDNIIQEFVEKPTDFVSDLAIIGIYYFKQGENLKQEIEYLLDHNIIKSGEYQLTDALENMKQKGSSFGPGEVDEWFDCGNKDATVHTNSRVLELNGEKLPKPNITLSDSKIIEPCYIGNNVTIQGSTVGPFVSLGDNTTIKESVIENSIVQNHSIIENAQLKNSMIGNFVEYNGFNNKKEVSLGDFSTLKDCESVE